MNVLHIEDNPSDAKLVQRQLSDTIPNLNLTLAKDLKSGLEAFRERAFDVVLLDLNLPDSKGMDTLVAVNEFTRTPLIVITSGCFPENAVEAMRKLCVHFYEKDKAYPFILSEAIEKFCDDKLRSIDSMVKSLVERGPK